MILKPFPPGSARGLFRFCLSAILLWLAPSTFADQRLAGHWQGAIEVPGMKLEIDVDFAEAGGVLSGDISILRGMRHLQNEHPFVFSDKCSRAARPARLAASTAPW